MNNFQKRIAEAQSVLFELRDNGMEWEALAGLVVKKLQAGGTVLTVGNGGSSAQSAHLTAELVGRYVRDREPLRAIDLSSDPAILTALVNDYDPADVFARRVKAIGRRGDVLVCLSTSGTSPNVCRAASVALERGLYVVAITGLCGGPPLVNHTPIGLGYMPLDAHIQIPSTSTPAIQEATLVLIHALCGEIDDKLTR